MIYALIMWLGIATGYYARGHLDQLQAARHRHQKVKISVLRRQLEDLIKK